MDEETVIITTTIIVIIAIIIGFMYFMIYESYGEIISEDALDDMCVNVLNNTNAKFYEEFGFQKTVPCILNDEIKIIGNAKNRVNT